MLEISRYDGVHQVSSATGQTATTFTVEITIPGTTTAGSYKLTVTNPDGGKVSKTLVVS